MKKIIATLVAVLFLTVGLHAQTGRSSVKSIDPVLTDIIRSYRPWHSVEFNGKLRYDKLPVSPSVKMYMVRDSLLQISVRVPLMGEIGRLHLTKKEFTVVNKMKRVYSSEPAENLFEIYPELIAHIQSLFLGRVVLLDSGELSEDNAMFVGVEEDREGGWMLIPAPECAQSRFNYGYLVGSNARTKAFLATLGDKGSLQILYSYKNRGEQMTIGYEGKGVSKPFEAELDFTSVKWGGNEMSPMRLSTYEKVSIKDFIRMLRNK